jgi:hypothetical protein
VPLLAPTTKGLAKGAQAAKLKTQAKGLLLAPPPIQLPSRRSENSGKSLSISHSNHIPISVYSFQGLDPNINIVPTGGSGWGSIKPTDVPAIESKPETTPQPTSVPESKEEQVTVTPTPATSAWAVGPNKLIEKSENAEYDRRGFKLGRDEFPTLGKKEAEKQQLRPQQRKKIHGNFSHFSQKNGKDENIDIPSLIIVVTTMTVTITTITEMITVTITTTTDNEMMINVTIMTTDLNKFMEQITIMLLGNKRRV